MISVSNKEARHIILTNQGLIENFFGAGKKATLNVIEHLGYVQIDTISVVERAHHHTIWTRLSDYKKSYLTDLTEKEKSVFEYWSHAAAFLPMKDFRFSLIRKNLFTSGEKRWHNDKKVARFVYDRIKTEGPLQSKDFEEKKKVKGWWEWKESKRALEQLFMEGKLMVAKRQGFQKVYDLTERILPKEVNTKTPTEKEYAQYLIMKAIRANGLVAKNEVAYLRGHAKNSITKAMDEMVESGEIIPLRIKGIDEILFSTQTNLARGKKIKPAKQVKILSPFDNSVIQRNRVKKIFDFDYTIECYMPEAKRKYGYFCLPVLFGDEFIGRVDCKAERSEQVLYVKNIFYDKKPSPQIKKELIKALNVFAEFNGCEKVRTL